MLFNVCPDRLGRIAKSVSSDFNAAVPTDMIVGLCVGDPVDIAIQWAKDLGSVIPVVIPCHEKRPGKIEPPQLLQTSVNRVGGDWESGKLVSRNA